MLRLTCINAVGGVVDVGGPGIDLRSKYSVEVTRSQITIFAPCLTAFPGTAINSLP